MGHPVLKTNNYFILTEPRSFVFLNTRVKLDNVGWVGADGSLELVEDSKCTTALSIANNAIELKYHKLDL